MNWLINLAVKASGLSWVWDKVDGYKTYGVSAVAILSGLAGVLSVVLPPLSAHDAAGLIAVLRGLPTNPAYQLLVTGLLGVGIGHKLSKAADSSVPLPNA